jgi:hypothetical protein
LSVKDVADVAGFPDLHINVVLFAFGVPEGTEGNEENEVVIWILRIIPAR